MVKRLNAPLANVGRMYPERIIQFGGGNFLRGFVDWVVDILNEETTFCSGIALVKATPGHYADLDAQDCLFNTYLHGIRYGSLVEETRLITSVNRTVYPYQDFASYLELARQEPIRFIFSNTTEAGIVFSEQDKLDDAPPATFPAKLTRLLHERYLHFEAAHARGCVIMPTELIEQNATRLRDIILQYARLWGLEADFSDWITQSNLFCNTLVDRIIPGYPEADAERVCAELGYEDRLLVAGEIYHSWIIEAPQRLLDEFPINQARTRLNIKIVEDAAPYRIIKVRLLNGAHSSLTPIGLLLGIESVRLAMEHKALGQFVQDLIFEEVIPSISEVPPAELRGFARDVFDRFRNPHIHHRLLTISLNSSSKVKERILPSLLGYLEKRGALPARLVLALAAFIRLYKGELNGAAIPLNDDAQTLDWFRDQWSRAATLDDLAGAVLANKALWDQDLTEIPGLVGELSENLRAIEAGELLERL